MKLQQKDMIRFGIYALLLVLINLVSSTLFFRIDLTDNRIYTLSEASRKAVSTLEDPLTIRIFLSENLPQPYNLLEQEMRDLMEEYSYHANDRFNYQIYRMDREGEKTNDRGVPMTELARQYGIQPIDIQSLEDNEVSLVSVYMGMVILQGDLSKTVNTIGTQGAGLEYEITGMIDELAARNNILLSMTEPIQIKLFFSQELQNMGQEYQSYPDKMESQVQDLQASFFNKLDYRYIDPSRAGISSVNGYNLNEYNLTMEDGRNVSVYAALVIERDGQTQKMELIQRTLLGSRIQPPAQLQESIKEVANQLLGVQQKVGYLSDHGAPLLYNYGMQQQQEVRSFGTFTGLIYQRYQMLPVTLDDLPPGLNSLVIAGVTEPFTDWELYQLDQFLMRGGSLSVFLDPFLEQLPQGQMAYYGAQPTYQPIDTGLEKLLAHHGLGIKQSYLMDQECFVNRSQAPGGGVQQVEIPFAPQILTENINQDSSILSNLKGLIMLKVAPLEIKEEQAEGKDIQVLFSSSTGAWEVSRDINLDPRYLLPPSEDQQGQHPLALLAQGKFTSYFADKPVPEAPVKEGEGEGDALLLGDTDTRVETLKEGQGGKLFLLGSSFVLGDNLLDREGQSPNAMFLKNLMDFMNGNEDYAIMRSKGQAYNPIKANLSSQAKTWIKIINIGLLPLLVILFGIFMWMRWNKRKKNIAQQFGEGEK